MKITRTVELEPCESAQLRFLEALRDTNRTVTLLRWRGVTRARQMGLPTRMIGQASGLSAAQVSRIASGKVKAF